MTTVREYAEYAANVIPEGTPARDIVTESETPDQVADALLDTHPPEDELDRAECRQALVERIEYLLG